jgi:hypothetical protein
MKMVFFVIKWEMINKINEKGYEIEMVRWSDMIGLYFVIEIR